MCHFDHNIQSEKYFPLENLIRGIQSKKCACAENESAMAHTSQMNFLFVFE